MANDTTTFARIDSFSRLGGSARIRVAYSSEVLTDYSAQNKIVENAYFQQTEKYLIDVDSSFSESEASFSKKIEAFGYQSQNSVKILIDEEALSLSDFSKLFRASLQHRNLYVEIMLNNGQSIKLDHIQIDFTYSYVKNIAVENVYEIVLRQAKQIEKTIDFVQSVTYKPAQILLFNSPALEVFNVFVKTYDANTSRFEVLVGTVDDIDKAKGGYELTFILKSSGSYYVFVKIKNSNHYQTFFIEIETTNQITSNETNFILGDGSTNPDENIQIGD